MTRVDVWLRHPEFEGREFLELEDFEQIAVVIVEEEVRLDAATWWPRLIQGRAVDAEGLLMRKPQSGTRRRWCTGGSPVTSWTHVTPPSSDPNTRPSAVPNEAYEPSFSASRQ